MIAISTKKFLFPVAYVHSDRQFPSGKVFAFKQASMEALGLLYNLRSHQLHLRKEGESIKSEVVPEFN
jgi:hypothetical protein